MSTALDKINAQTRAQLAPHEARYPGTDAPIYVRTLSEEEVDNAKIEAQRYLTKRRADVNIDPEFYDREVQRQIVWASLTKTDAAERDPLFDADSDVRKISTVELDALWRVYLENQDRSSVLRSLADEQIEELVDSCAKNEKALTGELALLDHASLVRVLVSVIKRLK